MKTTKTITKISILLAMFFVLSSLAFAERLPTVGGDDGSWGTVLNGFLLNALGENGTSLNNTMVYAANMNTSSVNSTHLVTGAVASVDILDATVALADMAASSVNSTHLVDNAVSTDDIQNATVALADMAASSVNSTHLVDAGIVADDIGVGQVNGTHLSGVTNFDFFTLADGDAGGWNPDAALTNFTITNGSTLVGLDSVVMLTLEADVNATGCMVVDLTAATSFVVNCTSAPSAGAVLNFMIWDPV